MGNKVVFGRDQAGFSPIHWDIKRDGNKVQSGLQVSIIIASQ